MIAKHHVTNTLLVPTMIRLMKQVPNPRSRYELKVRSLISGGRPSALKSSSGPRTPSASGSTRSSARPSATWSSATTRR